MRLPLDSTINSFNCKNFLSDTVKSKNNSFLPYFLQCNNLDIDFIKPYISGFIGNETIELFPGFIFYRKPEVIIDDYNRYIHVYLKHKNENDNLYCPHCGNKINTTSSKTHKKITLKDYIPLFKIAKCTFKIKYYKCDHCDKFVSRDLLFRVCNKKITHRLMFATTDALLNTSLSNRKVAQMYGINKNIVGELHTVVAITGYKSYDLTKVRYIGIDEHSIQKGHKYVTIILDLETKAIIYVSLGKKKNDIQPFFDKLKELNLIDNIKGFSCDCSSGFIKLAETYIPNAKIVLDEFHVLRIISKAFDSVRKDIVKLYQTKADFYSTYIRHERSPMKRTEKHLNELKEKLIKRGLSEIDIEQMKSMNNKKDESDRLQKQIELINKHRNMLALGLKEFLLRVKDTDAREAFLSCPDLKEILELGDAARDFWHPSLDGDSDDKEQRLKAILTQIEQWVERASKFKNIKMKNVCEFLSKHAQRIIYASVLDYRISNSVVEGINSHAKLLQRIHKGQIQVPTYICLLHRSFPGKVA